MRLSKVETQDDVPTKPQPQISPQSDRTFEVLQADTNAGCEHCRQNAVVDSARVLHQCHGALLAEGLTSADIINRTVMCQSLAARDPEAQSRVHV